MWRFEKRSRGVKPHRFRNAGGGAAHGGERVVGPGAAADRAREHGAVADGGGRRGGLGRRGRHAVEHGRALRGGERRHRGPRQDGRAPRPGSDAAAPPRARRASHRRDLLRLRPQPGALAGRARLCVGLQRPRTTWDRPPRQLDRVRADRLLRAQHAALRAARLRAAALARGLRRRARARSLRLRMGPGRARPARPRAPRHGETVARAHRGVGRV